MKKQSLYIAAAALVLASCASTGVKKSTEGYEAVSKEGFGTSAYIGDVRPRGSKMKNGEASGAQPVARMFVTDSMDISQG